MQIKTTMKYHSCLLEWQLSKCQKINIDEDVGEMKIPIHDWWDSRMVQQPLWKTIWSFHKKLKIELPQDPTFHF